MIGKRAKRTIQANRVVRRDMIETPPLVQRGSMVLIVAESGGLKVTTENGWFAARPSGTEEVYKIYAESFVGREHLASIQREAKHLIERVFEKKATC